MTPVEVAHRALRAMLTRAERAGLVPAPAVPAPDLAITAQPWVHRAPGVDPERYLAAADEIAHGRLALFALGEFDLEGVVSERTSIRERLGVEPLEVVVALPHA